MFIGGEPLRPIRDANRIKARKRHARNLQQRVRRPSRTRIGNSCDPINQLAVEHAANPGISSLITSPILKGTTASKVLAKNKSRVLYGVELATISTLDNYHRPGASTHGSLAEHVPLHAKIRRSDLIPVKKIR